MASCLDTVHSVLQGLLFLTFGRNLYILWESIPNLTLSRPFSFVWAAICIFLYFWFQPCYFSSVRPQRKFVQQWPWSGYYTHRLPSLRSKVITFVARCGYYVPEDSSDMQCWQNDLPRSSNTNGLTLNWCVPDIANCPFYCARSGRTFLLTLDGLVGLESGDQPSILFVSDSLLPSQNGPRNPSF